MAFSSRDSSGRGHQLGPEGWASLAILLVGSAALLFYLSEGKSGFGLTETSSDGGPPGSTRPRVATTSQSPSRADSPSSPKRARYDASSNVYESSDEPSASPTKRSSSPSASSSSSGPDPSFPETYTSATRLVNVFTGKGSGKTRRAFRVTGDWTLKWEARGSIFQVFVHDENGDLRTFAVNESNLGPGGHSGEVELDNTGTFRLRVNALSTWRIRVVQGG